MSGSSLNYLYTRSLEVDVEGVEDVECVVAELKRLGCDAAAERARPSTVFVARTRSEAT